MPASIARCLVLAIAAAPAEPGGVEHLSMAPLALVRRPLLLQGDIKPAANLRRPGLLLPRRLSHRPRGAHGDRRMQDLSDIGLDGCRPRRCGAGGHRGGSAQITWALRRPGQAGPLSGCPARDALECGRHQPDRRCDECGRHPPELRQQQAPEGDRGRSASLADPGEVTGHHRQGLAGRGERRPARQPSDRRTRHG